MPSIIGSLQCCCFLDCFVDSCTLCFYCLFCSWLAYAGLPVLGILPCIDPLGLALLIQVVHL